MFGLHEIRMDALRKEGMSYSTPGAAVEAFHSADVPNSVQFLLATDAARAAELLSVKKPFPGFMKGSSQIRDACVHIRPCEDPRCGFEEVLVCERSTGMGNELFAIRQSVIDAMFDEIGVGGTSLTGSSTIPADALSNVVLRFKQSAH